MTTPRSTLGLLLGLLLGSGCAANATISGLVQPGGRVQLYSGRELRLVLDEEAEPLRYLDGCVVHLEGNRFGRWFSVKDWFVEDAGYGFGAYVGLLRVMGTRVFLEDRRTNTTLVLDPLSAIALRGHDGQAVLVVGPLTGPSEVQAVVWRILAP